MRSLAGSFSSWLTLRQKLLSRVLATAQGQYEHLYIAMDTDGQMGSGTLWLPDSLGVRVPAYRAWEYCIYVYCENDFGIYTKEGLKLEKPQAGPKKRRSPALRAQTAITSSRCR